MSTPDYTSNVVQIHTRNGAVGLLDKIDGDLALLRWHTCTSPAGVIYLVHNIRRDGKRTTQQIQRVIMARILSRELIEGEFVDHIDRDGLNNRRDNLRVCTFQENLCNKKIYKNNKSGYKGVSYHVRINKYSAEISHKGKQIWLGYFETPKEAYEAYCQSAIKLHGKFARLK